jgi:hypothetical protein
MLESGTFISDITRLEVLGFHGLLKEEEEYFTELFLEFTIIEINKAILDEAIQKRRAYNMKLGDSIVAATASVYGLQIYTRNTADFMKISNLKVINPVL